MTNQSVSRVLCLQIAHYNDVRITSFQQLPPLFSQDVHGMQILISKIRWCHLNELALKLQQLST